MAIGIVEDNDDPLYKGRVRVRVFGKLDQNVEDDLEKDFNIPTECLPWARPRWADAGGIRGAGNFSIPKLGSILNIEYENGNEYAPIYTGYKCVSDDVISEIQSSYKNAHVLLYDTVFGDKKDGKEYSNEREGEYIKIFFTEEKGLMFDYATTDGSTSVNIKPDNSLEIKNLDKSTVIIDKEGNITVKNEGKTEITTKGDATIKVDGKTSVESAKDITVKSNAKISVEAGTSATVTAKQAKIDAKLVQITGGTLQVNGTVAPSAGPFCGIPTCPVTGLPHGGNIVANT